MTSPPTLANTTCGRRVKMRVRLKGVNKKKVQLADGSTKTYYYAWKGGPRIEAEPGTELFVELYSAAVATKRKATSTTLRTLIDDFKDRGEYKGLGAKSKRAYDSYLKLLEAEFGDMTRGALEDIRAARRFQEVSGPLPRYTAQGRLRLDDDRPRAVGGEGQWPNLGQRLRA